ncbi:S-layer homology domain-containing protein [Allocoleopsis franciscana]|uniref:S-layer homology domain-containing protein n=1 Tax=Allocoleopsis franciscana TaxID=2886352 RepID=UPI00155AB0BB|nr:S-layer homology domain-containing protein [Allocoleopsis franciscana]
MDANQSNRLKKKLRSLSLLVLLLASSFWLSSCKKEQPVNRFQEEINQLKTENAKLRAEVDQLKTQLDNPVAQLSPSPTPKPVAVAPNAPKPVAFEDIKGVLGEKQIIQLGQLGVFDSTSGNFDPKAPITRAEFARWLVRTNNAIFPGSSDKTIRLSEAGKATFSDVPPTHPDFPYIQGLANAGYSISDDEKTFKPEQILTREQMLAMKVALDHRVPLESYKGGAPGGWTDSNKISKKYWPAIYVESVFQNNANISRTFGALKTLNPQAPVTRSEAVLSISAIGDNVAGFTTAEEAVEKLEQQSLP